jgi:hypothetical protein
MTHHDGLHEPPGPPDMRLGSMAIWVRGREFSDSEDYWDANWLSVLMQVDAAYAVVQAEGPILHAGELSDLVEGCMRLYRDMAGDVVFNPIEPNVRLKLAINARGQLDVGVDLTADHLAQSHHFDFALDQSYLPAFIAGGQDVLQKFPIRGSRDGSDGSRQRPVPAGRSPLPAMR